MGSPHTDRYTGEEPSGLLQLQQFLPQFEPNQLNECENNYYLNHPSTFNLPLAGHKDNGMEFIGLGLDAGDLNDLWRNNSAPLVRVHGEYNSNSSSFYASSTESYHLVYSAPLNGAKFKGDEYLAPNTGSMIFKADRNVAKSFKTALFTPTYNYTPNLNYGDAPVVTNIHENELSKSQFNNNTNFQSTEDVHYGSTERYYAPEKSQNINISQFAHSKHTNDQMLPSDQFNFDFMYVQNGFSQDHNTQKAINVMGEGSWNGLRNEPEHEPVAIQLNYGSGANMAWQNPIRRAVPDEKDYHSPIQEFPIQKVFPQEESLNERVMFPKSGKTQTSQAIMIHNRKGFLNPVMDHPSRSPQLEGYHSFQQHSPLDEIIPKTKKQSNLGEENYQFNGHFDTSLKTLQRNLDKLSQPHRSVRSTSSGSTYYNTEKRNVTENGPKYNIVRGGLGGPNPRIIGQNRDIKNSPLSLKVDNASVESINSVPWTKEEQEDGRRIIRIERLQHGTRLTLNFSIVDPSSDRTSVYGEEGIDWVEVSMIKFISNTSQQNSRAIIKEATTKSAGHIPSPHARNQVLPDSNGYKQNDYTGVQAKSEKPDYFMTSVEFIEVIECLIGHKSLEHSERRKERGRIRLNLMRFWLKIPLPSKKSLLSGDHDEFVIGLALKIRKYSVSKPPGFNKEVRIMPWEKLEPAMQRALEYYFAEEPLGDG